MNCQTKTRAPLRIAATLAVAGGLLSPLPADAHHSDFNFSLGAGGSGLLEEAVTGHYGFTPRSPFYLFGEARKFNVVYKPDEDAYRFALEGGVEFRRVGLAGRADYHKESDYGFSMLTVGGTFMYRFLTWTLGTKDDDLHLTREERQLMREKRERDMIAEVPTATSLILDYDHFVLDAVPITSLPLAGERFAATIHWKFRPWWVMYPKVEAYAYVRAPVLDAAATTAFASKSLHMIRVGPHGPFSATPGTISNAQQIYNHFTVDEIFGVNFAITRMGVGTPDASALSFWLGFTRRFARKPKWSFSPIFEYIRLGDQSMGFLSVNFHYEVNGPYQP